MAFLYRVAGLGFFGLTIGLALDDGIGVALGLAVVAVGAGVGLDGAEKAEAEAMTVRLKAAVPATAPMARREGVRARKKFMGEAMSHEYQSCR